MHELPHGRISSSTLQSLFGLSSEDKDPDTLSYIALHLNGTKFTVVNPDPLISLNEWIRSQPGHKGTKVMCHEGGCGCCVVALTKKNKTQAGKDEVTLSVNSCLFPLLSADGCHVTTTEGIGNQRDGFHPVQQRLAEHGGSQCGFCTPGIVMSMYSFLKENPKPRKQEIEDVFDGNICRCTGYRPILDAMKTFAVDEDPVDIEDVDKCCRTCINCSSQQAFTAPPSSRSAIKWYKAASLKELFAVINKHPSESLRLVGGNTAKGIYKEDGPFSVMVDINSVPELQCIKVVDDYLVVGAGLPLSSLIKVFVSHSDKCSALLILANHLRKVANVSVRNVGTVGGNLMIAHEHPDFPSDVLTILETIGANLIIGSSSGDIIQKTMLDFLALDMKRKVIFAVAVPLVSDEVVIQTYKVTQRAVNTHAYVNAGFAWHVDQSTMAVRSMVRIVFGGIGRHSIHARETEKFLSGKVLTDPDTLKGSLHVLEKEIQVNSALTFASSEKYHKSLALALMYKFYVAALGEKLSARIRSAAVSSLSMVRPVSRGVQDYGTIPERFPVTKPMSKLTAKLQASGEAQYTNDIPNREGELYAAFVYATQANCQIDTVSSCDALKLPGVKRMLTSKHIPLGGENIVTVGHQVLSTGEILHAGQAVALIIADTQEHADSGAKAVRITYKDLRPPILSIKQAIEAKSFHTNPSYLTDVKTGDVEGAMSSAPYVVSGEIETGSQHHFHMETQVALCVPEEEGMTVYSATQSMTPVQNAVARILGIPANNVNVTNRRCGGAFGGKLRNSYQTAQACALAAHVMKKPVRLKMNFNTNMIMLGKRSPFLAAYKVATDERGILQAIDITYYADLGCSNEDNELALSKNHWDNVYYCPNWMIRHIGCFTHTPTNTHVRAPGTTQAVFIMESIMEHVAKTLNKTPEEVRFMNLYQPGQLTPSGHALLNCNVSTIWNDLLESSEFEKRKTAVEEYNKLNRWRKRGIAVVPGRFDLRPFWQWYTVTVSIYASDGTVAITHGGIELGQGINVKVAQVAAYVLGIPIENISIKAPSTHVNPNSTPSGGSVSSERCCKGVFECCHMLNERIKPVREQMQSATWKEIVSACGRKRIDLSAKYMVHGDLSNSRDEMYHSFGVSCSEVEVDILTGERQVLRCDIRNDCGESLNPAVDIGQIEGAFMMGLGYWLTEKVFYDPITGRELSDGTWFYKPPSAKDIPLDLRVTLPKNSPNQLGFLGSKAAAEPPMNISSSCLFAIKHALESARAEIKEDQFFPLHGPATVEDTQQAALVDHRHFTI